MFLPMSKIQIVGPKNLFMDAVSFIHKDGRLHIQDVRRDMDRFGALGLRSVVLTGEFEGQRVNMESDLVKINGIMGSIPAPAATGALEDKDGARRLQLRIREMGNDELLDEVRDVLGGVDAKANALSNQEHEIENQLSLMARYEPILEKIQPVASELGASEGFKTKALVFTETNKEQLAADEKKIRGVLSSKCQVHASGIDAGCAVMLIVYSEQYQASLNNLLEAENITQMHLPASLEEEPLDVVLDRLKADRRDLPRRLKQIRDEKSSLSQTWYNRIVTIRSELANRIEEFRAMPNFGETEFTFVLTGWIPKKDINELNNSIKDKFEDLVTVMEMKLSSTEAADAPVKLYNPEYAEPFEYFYSYIKIPKYDSTDATTMMAFTFPMIFGMIVGDVAYGFAMLLLAKLFYSVSEKRKDVFWSMAGILKLAGYGTIPWGLLYFEALGNVPEVLLMKSMGLTHHQVVANPELLNIAGVKMPIVNRMTDIKPLLVMSVGMGALHLTMGFYQGFKAAMHHGHTKHAIEKLGFVLGLVIGPILLILGKAVPVLSFLSALSGLVIAVGVGMIGYGGGVKGIVEIFGAVSNMLSYARIMAIGLVGVFMAYVANLLYGIISSGGGVAAILGGIAAAAMLHFINVVICAFSPSIHTMRLHLVECFTKFHEPAENEYKPFKTPEEN